MQGDGGVAKRRARARLALLAACAILGRRHAVSSSPTCIRSSPLALAAARSTAPSPACLARSQAPTAADNELIELPAAARAAGGQALTEPKLEHFCIAFCRTRRAERRAAAAPARRAHPSRCARHSNPRPAAGSERRPHTRESRRAARAPQPQAARMPTDQSRRISPTRPLLSAGEQLEPDTILRRRRRRLDFARAALGTSFACRCHTSPTWRPSSRRRRCRAAGWLQRPMARRRRERRLRRGTVEARRRFEEVKDSECIGVVTRVLLR